jgi:hypothetical protein
MKRERQGRTGAVGPGGAKNDTHATNGQALSAAEAYDVQLLAEAEAMLKKVEAGKPVNPWVMVRLILRNVPMRNEGTLRVKFAMLATEDRRTGQVHASGFECSRDRLQVVANIGRTTTFNEAMGQAGNMEAFEKVRHYRHGQRQAGGDGVFTTWGKWIRACFPLNGNINTQSLNPAKREASNTLSGKQYNNKERARITTKSTAKEIKQNKTNGKTPVVGANGVAIKAHYLDRPTATNVNGKHYLNRSPGIKRTDGDLNERDASFERDGAVSTNGHDVDVVRLSTNPDGDQNTPIIDTPISDTSANEASIDVMAPAKKNGARLQMQSEPIQPDGRKAADVPTSDISVSKINEVSAEVFGSVPSLSLADVDAQGSKRSDHAVWFDRMTKKLCYVRAPAGEAAFRSLREDYSEDVIKRAMTAAVKQAPQYIQKGWDLGTLVRTYCGYEADKQKNGGSVPRRVEARATGAWMKDR